MSLFFSREQKTGAYHASSKTKNIYHQKQLQSTDVYLALVWSAPQSWALYAFLDPKSLFMFALIVTCFCLWWCEV